MTTYSYITKSFTHEGRRYKVYGKTEKEAYQKLFEKQQALIRQEDVTGGNTPLKTWADIAFDTYKPNATYTYVEECRARFRKYVVDDLGSLPISRITSLQLQRILNDQKGKSSSHISKLAQEMYFVFDRARRTGMITKNPAEDLVKPTGTKNKRRALTDLEREHLLKVIPTDPRFVFFELMLYCGCRPGEAAGVRYDDVTDMQGTPFLHIRGTKTANSDRFVPLPKELHPLMLSGEGRTGLVARTQAGTAHDKSSYKRMVSTLKREMNISMGCKVYRNELIPPLPLADDFVPYILRHTYCTDLKKKGIDVRIAKDLMGHADIRTTANIYDHTDADTLMIAARQMGLMG